MMDALLFFLRCFVEELFLVFVIFFFCVLQRNGANIQDAIRIVNLLCIRSGLPPLAPPLASPTTMAVPQLLRYC